MSWRVEWSAPAERSLLNMPWKDATRVDAAVQRLASTGQGDLVRLPEDHAVTLRLRVKPYIALLSLDRQQGILHVINVYTFR